MIRRLARATAERAGALLADVRPDQARAITVEVEHIPSAGEALVFALGCLWAAARIRLTALTAAVVFSRIALASALAVFGVFHLVSPLGPACAKLELIAGAGGACLGAATPAEAQQIAETGLAHWIARFALMAAIGVLHLYLAASLAAGRTRRLLVAAAVTGGLAIAVHAAGFGPPASPLDYVAQLGALCLAALLLDRLMGREAGRLRGACAA